MLHDNPIPRRQFIAAGTAVACAFATGLARAQTAPSTTQVSDPIIDIHQHTTYQGRSNAALLHHQKKMGATQTILLPGGSPVDLPSTLKGKANGLYAGAGVIDTCIPIARDHPREYYFAANEVPDLPEAKEHIESALKAGAVCIGEQKFCLPVDSPQMEMIYRLAQDFSVPVLMHFQYDMFNTGYERFGKVLDKWSKVTFIGHAVSFWSNVDAALSTATTKPVSYPKGPIKPGGLTDRYLSDHANLFGDLSAYSGLNSLIRDEDHARGFIARHQDKLMFGSDCADPAGFGPTCIGANLISAIRRLSPSKAIERKLLYNNANTLFRL